jgi:YVTN family beta-propeller protein
VVLALAFGALPAAAAPFAYVANAQSKSVSVIDTATNKVVGTPIPTPPGLEPVAVAVAPDGTQVYVTLSGEPGKVSVIDTATNKVVATVMVGNFPVGVAVSPDGTRAYVSNTFSGNVSVIDTTTNPPTVRAIPVGDTTGGAIAVSPDGKKVYVGCHGVGVIDTATNKVVATVDVGGGVIQGLAVSPDGKHVYGTVHAEATETFVVIDTTTNPPKVVQTIELRKDPEGIAVSPDGKHVYVARTLGNNVAVIDTPFSGPARVVAGVGVGLTPKESPSPRTGHRFM